MIDRFARVPVNVARAGELSDAAVRLYVYLASYANGAGVAWPSQSTIARELGWSLPKVRRALAGLQAPGLVVVVQRGSGAATSRYTLPALLPGGAGLGAAPANADGEITGDTPVTGDRGITDERGITGDRGGVTPVIGGGNTGDRGGVSPVFPEIDQYSKTKELDQYSNQRRARSARQAPVATRPRSRRPGTPTTPPAPTATTAPDVPAPPRSSSKAPARGGRGYSLAPLIDALRAALGPDAPRGLATSREERGHWVTLCRWGYAAADVARAYAYVLRHGSAWEQRNVSLGYLVKNRRIDRVLAQLAAPQEEATHGTAPRAPAGAAAGAAAEPAWQRLARALAAKYPYHEISDDLPDAS